ncbi:MAG TPA: tyrosine-type recombinase/integrase, partial [Isosphaeraceae bacterium]|nr:tyrosine-type recombinase/integrase [Isosphaeraceae bacterium]
RPVHRPGLVGPPRRGEGPVGDPCPADHGAPLRRHGVRLLGSGHPQVLPLQRGQDFHQDGDEATVTLHEKGDKHRRIGLHFAAAEAISAYIAKAEITKGPLFRARLNSRSKKLGLSPIGAVTMYNLVRGYLSRLPSSMREEEVTDEDGTVRKVKRCIYTPHSLRATTATLLLDAGVDIIKVKELLGHRHVTTTQIYDKRRRSLKEGASHDVPI